MAVVKEVDGARRPTHVRASTLLAGACKLHGAGGRAVLQLQLISGAGCRCSCSDRSSPGMLI